MNIKIDNDNSKIIISNFPGNIMYNFIEISIRYISVLKIKNIVYNVTNIQILQNNKDIFEYDEEYFLTKIKVDINDITYIRSTKYNLVYLKNDRYRYNDYIILNLKNSKLHNREDIALHMGMYYYFFINGIIYSKEEFLKEHKKYMIQKNRKFKIQNMIQK